MGYVIRVDGSYLRRSAQTTHTGTHTTDEWVTDVDRATVFYRPVMCSEIGYEKLEAVESRTVTLITKEKDEWQTFSQ